MVMTTAIVNAFVTGQSNSKKKTKKKNVITATTPTIKVKPNKLTTPVPAHLKSNGRYPRNPNAVPGKQSITHGNPIGPRMTPRLHNTVPGRRSNMNTTPIGPKYNSKPLQPIKQTKTTTTGSPRGHYATRMAQGLLNRPTSKSAMDKLYKK